MAKPRCGDYAIKWGYHFLCVEDDSELASVSDGATSRSFWNSLWKINVPNKVPEDVLHALCDCTNLKKVWSSDFHELAAANHQFRSFADLFGMLIKNQCKLDQFATTCWMIWNMRNKFRVHQPVLPLDKISASTRDYLSEFLKLCPKAAKQVRPVKKVWKPPDDGKVKAKFDGAMFDELNEDGIGVVVRNPQEEIIAALSGKMPKPSSVDVLESLAARRATYFVLELEFQDSIFKGDSEISIKALQSGIP
nr:hypothetical protein CFP56_68191 [Quercus suber]